MLNYLNLVVNLDLIILINSSYLLIHLCKLSYNKLGYAKYNDALIERKLYQ